MHATKTQQAEGETHLFKQLVPLLLWGAQALLLRLHGAPLCLQRRQRLMETNHFLLYVRVRQLLRTGKQNSCTPGSAAQSVLVPPPPVESNQRL